MDKKLLAHAKDYIDAMARGQNPLTGALVPADDLINEVKISRCLFFVSQVLEEALAKPAPVAKRLLPYAPDREALASLELSPVPVTISELVKNINVYTPQHMKNLKPADVTDWLATLGFLRVETVNNKTRKRITLLGAQNGIEEHERQATHGKYYMLLYTLPAQQFIVDNLEAIG